MTWKAKINLKNYSNEWPNEPPFGTYELLKSLYLKSSAQEQGIPIDFMFHIIHINSGILVKLV